MHAALLNAACTVDERLFREQKTIYVARRVAWDQKTFSFEGERECRISKSMKGSEHPVCCPRVSRSDGPSPTERSSPGDLMALSARVDGPLNLNLRIREADPSKAERDIATRLH
jgi:hypothetical protein